MGSGLNRRRKLLTLLMYILLSLGIFGHEAVNLAPVSFRHVEWSTLGASFVVGFALLPPVMRWINRRKRKPSWEQVITAFSIGFFIDLSSKQVLATILKVVSH
jgi:uncharacterized membrane protein YczE